MSFILRLFRSEKPPDDETVLSSLARDISRRQTLLADIRARERTASALVTLYTLAAWLVYLAVWYFGFVSGGSAGRVKPVERAVRALPVFVGPIVILFIRRIVQIWYARKGDAEDKTLQTLLKAQRAKVEEIKKKTNFYETRELLSRYDSGSVGGPTPSASPSGNPGGGRGASGGGGSVSTPNTPQRPGQGQAQRQGGPRPSMLQAPPPPQPSAPPTPQRRGWFDLVADVLVGPDDSSLSAADKARQAEKQKYALICAKCFTHNGLVLEGMWGESQFTCPKCGHFNPSPRSRGLVPGAQLQSQLSPMSPAPRSPLSMSHAPEGRGAAEAAVPVSAAGGERQGGLGRSTQAQGVPRRRSARGGHGQGVSEGGEEEMEVDSE